MWINFWETEIKKPAHLFTNYQLAQKLTPKSMVKKWSARRTKRTWNYKGISILLRQQIWCWSSRNVTSLGAKRNVNQILKSRNGWNSNTLQCCKIKNSSFNINLTNQESRIVFRWSGTHWAPVFAPTMSIWSNARPQISMTVSWVLDKSQLRKSLGSP